MIHRDDIDMDDAEALVAHIQSLHPGVKVVFAGDANNPDSEELIKEVHATLAQRFANGECWSCNAKMTNFRVTNDDIEFDEGWECHTPIGDEASPPIWECPACQAKAG